VTWLLPSALAIGGIAAAVAVVLHFIARSRPLAEPLPTTRFIPERPIHARTRSIALTDIPLLLIRVAAVLLLAAAIAAPVLAAARGRVARVIVADRSRDVANIQEVRDSVRALFRTGDVLVAFDTDAAVVPSLDSLKSIDAKGSLSTGLTAAVRAGAALATHVDSAELVIVSPLTDAEIDRATLPIREIWPGRARVVRTAALLSGTGVPRSARDDAGGSARDDVVTNGTTDDPVIAGLSLMGITAPTGNIRLVRTRVPASDTAWARDSGHVLIHWPSGDENAHWPKRATIDAIGGVASTGGALVARFPRLWFVEGRAIAHWADGEPAAVERAIGHGCIRDVAIVFDPASDVTLRSSFRDFVRPLLDPCGGSRVAAALDSATVAGIAGTGRLASSGALRDRASETSRWTPWLLFAVAALLTLELALRRTTKAAA
jgi:hypothetical protein